ncbi:MULTISPECIES: efflux RND transporter periplasmic adaptor subunit [unclassified Sinorhizobium]|uniref:efflux RND transporter periplasmic adaptor subunit n=1 Tax=unclassified Sinorhizobium TaxID=2613772 RepID=UPI0024C409D1|nr:MULTISPECIES: efflux RND transporter periplasmic adaptor subunit [unclassified Sinorhizobium]MDK1377909.1 efflux RND transporter periplasmic adaptor subunit [Sinorhizobium sp. 6-70]MDK1480467.1 efflux RND transporter periplasmic adaptor subunit [Sinorhizobium sp. 6-117]
MSSRLAIAMVVLASTLAGIAVSPVISKIPGMVRVNPAADASTGPQVGGSSGKTVGKAPARAGGAAVQVVEVKKEDLPVIISTFANVQAPETVAVNARISSQITGIHVKDGQMVKADDLLFSLDDRAFKAQLSRDEAILAKDTALLADAEIELDRARTLRDDKSGTQQSYDTALSTEQSDKATVAADQATVEADKVSLAFTKIRAPISGRLGAIQVTVGDLVDTPSGASPASLVTITAIDPIEVAFHLPEKDLQGFKARLESGAPPQVKARLAGTGEVIGEGVLDFIDSAVDAATGTVMMRAKFDNGGQKLWPGQYVDVDVEEKILPQTAVIPAVAVQSGQKGDFVYRLTDDDRVELRPVVVAANDGRDAAISSGLAAGDKVVTEGQLDLKAGDKARIAEQR